MVSNFALNLKLSCCVLCIMGMTVCCTLKFRSYEKVVISKQQIDGIFKNKKLCQADSDYYYKVIQLAGIARIENQVDGQTFRFWQLSASDLQGIKVIEIRHTGEGWTSSYKYLKIFASKTFCLDSLIYEVERATPASGWSKFGYKLDSLGINKLKEQEEIPGYELCMDGGELLVEVASGAKYRRLHYPCWEDYRHTLKEVIQLNDLLELCHNEFGFDTTY